MIKKVDVVKKAAWSWTKSALAPFLYEVLKDSIKKSIEMEVEAQVKKLTAKD